ncbi:E3 ubiquitin-protein ligase RFWD3-like [Schistocerca cancellata]|uniref:E3 ubiquitin-protein ligase RFWD3-like n=1 Tax=Schistocerca cancellata TaxID=274614 RepID=UPI002117D3CA|nr:E3 ubiquitin-protein ligase RFWD3-like [Schistocerca cancellata]
MEDGNDSDATVYDGDMETEEEDSEVAVVHESVASGTEVVSHEGPQSSDTGSFKADCQSNENQAYEHKNTKDDLNASDDGDDGSLCPICMDFWTNAGSHRLISLRCGHLFGYSCITRWLQVSCSAGQRRCPQCNKKASPKDIRFLYARRVQALDTVEKEKLKSQVESLQQEKNRLVLELAQSKLNQELHLKEIWELKRKCEQLLSSQSQNAVHGREMSSSQSSSQRNIRILHDRTIEVCKSGGCRVAAFSSWHKLLVVSQSSTNNLFSGFGIKKIDAVDLHPTQFLFLHPKPIRDMAFHHERNELLLTVSLDKCAKLVDITSNSVVHTYTTDSSLWSCCWDVNDPNVLFVGSQNGVVSQFDMRQTSNAVARHSVPGDTSPVTSLAAFPAKGNRTLSRGGFLACRLNSCCAYERNADNFSVQHLPLSGPFTSLCYDEHTDHILISTRPNARVPNSCHILCQFGADGTSAVCCPVHTFMGSTTQRLLSRPCTVSVQGDTLVAAHIESSKIVAVWSVSSGQRLLSLPASEPIIDICPLNVDGILYLSALSEKSLRLYSVKHM